MRILATSRERLHLQGEQLYPISGLDYPGDEGEEAGAAGIEAHSAVALFLKSTRRLRPDFVPEPGDLPAVVRICRLVEGMPLGLEMAASWVSVLPPAAIAAEIGESLDLLETDARDVPPRQRSMRAVFDATWQRMSGEERDAFTRLSVFHGGFTREAAQAVAGATLRTLVALSDKALLHYERSRDRYQVHELLRQYAAERLARHPDREIEARDRHSRYYCAWVQEREAELKGAQQESVSEAIDADAENLQSAWAWAVRRRRKDSLRRAADGLAYFYEWRGQVQRGREAFRAAVEGLTNADDGGEPRLLATLLAWQGLFTYLLGEEAAAEGLLRESASLLESPGVREEETRKERALVYAQLGFVSAAVAPERAWSFYERSLALFRGLERHWETSELLARMGRWAYIVAEFGNAERLFDESLAIKRALGDRRGVARVLGRLSQTAIEQGDFDRAERLARESHAIYAELGIRYGLAEGLRQLGVTQLWRGRSGEARRLLEQSLALCRDLGYRSLVAEVHSLYALALSLLGAQDEARAEAEEGLRLSRDTGDPNQVVWSLWVLGLALVPREAYAEAEPILHESVAISGRVSTEAVELRQLGWALSLLGHVLWRRGDLPQARQVLLDALSHSVRLGGSLPLLVAFPAIALILAQQGETVRAVELHALVWRYPLAASARGWFHRVGRDLDAVAAALPADVAAAARARGQALDLRQTAVALLNELPHQEGEDED